MMRQANPGCKFVRVYVRHLCGYRWIGDDGALYSGILRARSIPTDEAERLKETLSKMPGVGSISVCDVWIEGRDHRKGGGA